MPSVDEILIASWRIYPVLLLTGAGTGLCVRGICLHRGIPPDLRDPRRALEVARSFRTGIAGACLLGWAVGWWLSIGWVVFVAFIVLGEEMLETSTMIAALRGGIAREKAPSGPA